MRALSCPRCLLGVRFASTAKSSTSVKGFWSAERLRTTPTYPLSLEVSTPAAGVVTKRTTGYFPADVLFSTRQQSYARTQIVSPGLCDDILKYIGPTLEKHKGCDILDLNPGAGLWSRKLHEFLQPRSHVLVDSSPALWDRWLKPLLDEPGSTYKLVEGDMARLATFEKIFDEGLFPHQKRVKPGEPDAQRLNDSLLVTGSLLWSPRLPGFNFDSMSKQVILQYAEQAWKNTHLHACGPVRSLLWMPANDARSVVPRSESSRGKYDFYLDTLGNNTEVVTQEHMPRTPGRGGLGRQPQAEIESVIHAVRRGKEHGFELPPHRREHIHDFADDVARMTNGTGRLDALGVQQYLEEQEQKGKSTVGINPERLIEHLQTQKALNEGVPKGSRQRSLSNRNATETQAQMLLRQAVGSVQRTRVKVDQLANLGEDIYLLECEILGLAEGAEKEKQLARLETLQDEFDAGLKKTQKVYRGSVLAAVDDRLAIRSPVPRLSWDSRPYEPLIAKPEEAWPAMGISLIDSTPRPLPSGKSPDWYDWVQDFATALMSKTEQPLLGALENLQHGAGDLITKAPSLTDPKRGGRLSMTQLRVRMLTVDMLEELCQAYRDWPFRHPDANHTRYFRLKQVQGGSS